MLDFTSPVNVFRHLKHAFRFVLVRLICVCDVFSSALCIKLQMEAVVVVVFFFFFLFFAGTSLTS